MFYRGDHFSEVHVHRPIFFIGVLHSGTLSSYLYVFVHTIVDFVLKIYMCLKLNVSYSICPALSLSVFLFSYSFSRWWPLGPTQTSEIAKTERDERKQTDLPHTLTFVKLRVVNGMLPGMGSKLQNSFFVHVSIFILLKW